MGSKLSYRDLIVWQKSIELVVLVYKLTETFPKFEIYGLASQMQHAAVSIPSNIAEGSRRKTEKDTMNFLTISFGSGSELETQIEISKRLKYSDTQTCDKLEKLLEEVMKMLNKMIPSSKYNYNA